MKVAFLTTDNRNEYKNYGAPAPYFGAAPTALCLVCHGSAAKVALKTQNTKPNNPHDSPHYGTQLDCNFCHRQHAKSEDYCAQCHKFNFVVP